MAQAPCPSRASSLLHASRRVRAWCTVRPMRYFVTLDGEPGAEPVVVDVVAEASGALNVSVGGRRVEVDVVAAGDPLMVRVDGALVDLAAVGGRDRASADFSVLARGHRSILRVQSERARAAGSVRRAPSGESERIVRSPMPGRVVKVLVQGGDDVQAGQGLVIVEAMKMENEVRARVSGRVAEVHVVSGATVDGRTKLVTLV
jgi:biotin carboxyl carrier protein